MFIHSLGKRIKNFFKIKIFTLRKRGKDNSYRDENTKTWYYDNGNIKALCRYENGKLHGISVHYYENGNVKLKETYVEGVLEGITKKYDENGKLIIEEIYRSGNLIERKFYGIKDNLS